MKIRINIQKDSALAAGRDEYGLRIVNVPASEFSAEEKATLTRHTAPPYTNDKGPDADYYLDMPRTEPGHPNGTGHSEHQKQQDAIRRIATEATPEAVHQILQAITAAGQKNAAAFVENQRQTDATYEAEVAQLLTLAPADMVEPHYNTWQLIRDARIHDEDPRLADQITQAREIIAARVEDQKAQELAQAQAKENAAAAEKQAKADWIEQHGSDHLKRAHARGYDCQRLYATQRAALELPEYTIDFDDKAQWKTRSCPSVEALDALDKAPEGATVVWLTSPPEGIPLDDDGYTDEDWQAREAIVIREYLGSYDLVREI